MNGVLDPHKVVELGYVTNTVPENLQPNSIDLSLGQVYQIEGPLVLFANRENRRRLPQYKPLNPFPYEGVSMYKLFPGRRYQIEFRERLNLPSDVCALTLVRSTMAKSGCTGENGLFDSGYHGACGMMVSVQTDSYIEVGASVAQMIFLKAETSKTYNGFYQGTESPLEWSK
jgi:deoxycytidine triphosphate deaminase